MYCSYCIMFKNTHTYDHNVVMKKTATPMASWRRPAQPIGRFSAARQTYGIKVTHLPYGITESQVTHIFQQYGSIGSVSVKQGENECYAFVNFHSKSCAQTAAEKTNGMVVGGNTISTRVQGDSQSPASEDIHAVKVTYLSKQTTKESLTRYFSLGDNAIISINLIDCGSSSPYNYAYINYSSQSAAEMAERRLNRAHIEGSYVKVKYVGIVDTKSVPPPQKPETPPVPKNPAFKNSPSVVSYPPQSAQLYQVRPVTSPYVAPLSMPRAPPVHEGPMMGRSHSVISCHHTTPRNVPGPIPRRASQPVLETRPEHTMVSQSRTVKVSMYGELSSEDIEDVFGQFGKVREKPIVHSGTPKFCYVNFESPEMASKACVLNNTGIKGIRIMVKLKQRQRAASMSNQESLVVPCSSLVVSILQTQYKQRLEKLEAEHGVSLKLSPKSIKIWGEADKLATVEASLQLLIEWLEEEVSNEECELPCHSLPLFEQNLAVVRLHKIEETHGVKFLVLQSAQSSMPLDLDSFRREVTKCFQNCGTSSVQTEAIPKRSDFMSFLKQKSETPTSPSAGHVWLWQNDDGTGYTPYMPDACTQLNHSFSISPQSSLLLAVGKFTYMINFSSMTQTNTSSGRVRPIKRVAKHTLNSCVQWTFQDDQSQYTPYTVEESAEIEQMFQSNASKHLTIKGYAFDFVTMTQRNVLTRHSRKIRRELTVSQSQIIPNTEHILTVQVQGLPSSLPPAMKVLLSTVSSATVEKECHLHASCSEDFKSRLLQNVSKYLVTPSLAVQCLKLKGMPQYVEKVALLAEQEKNSEYEQQLQASKGMGGSGYEVPKEWTPQHGNYMLGLVTRYSEEWNQITIPFLKTLPCAKVTRLERIQNKWLWERYCFAKNRMSKANKGSINEEHLFHGTRDTPPEKVIKSEKGIDFRYSKQGLWGEGSYFAVNASYSDRYSHSPHGTQAKQMLICKVLTGECCDYGTKSDSSLRQPPTKPSSRTDAFEEERYDSVKGYTNGSFVYIVYDHEKVYPAYLVTYCNT